VYAIYLTKKEGDGLPDQVTMSSLRPRTGTKVHLLGLTKSLTWETDTSGLTTIHVPASALQTPPCQYAFAFRFEPSAKPSRQMNPTNK
jgi:hypothetical protein